MIAYDDTCHDWLLSTSEGFYSLNLQQGTAKKIDSAPPVSVMGLNVLQKMMLANGFVALSADCLSGIDSTTLPPTISLESQHQSAKDRPSARKQLLA